MEHAVHRLLRQHPARLVSQQPDRRYEGYYASVFYAYFASLGWT
jgi:hypothetical protein